MTNVIVKTNLIDSTKRALVRYVIHSDGTAEANTKILDVSGLANSLNTNGYIMTGETDAKSVYRTSVQRIFGSYAAKNKGYIELGWEMINGAGNNQGVFATVGEGFFDYNFTGTGHADAIPTPSANTTGDIIITAPLTNLDHITMYVDLKKDNRDFDAGQTRDPLAFNNGI